MIRACVLGCCLALCLAATAHAADPLPAIGPDLEKALATLEAAPGSQDLLALSNAGATMVQGRATYEVRDTLRRISGCSDSSRNIYFLPGKPGEPLWYALYNRANGKMHYAKASPKGLRTGDLDARPETILTAEAWGKADSELMGMSTYPVLSVALSWAAGAPESLLRAAELHGHICQGLNAGHALCELILRDLPLDRGERYIPVASPAFCGMDAMQLMLGATSGTRGMFGLATNFPDNEDPRPALVLLREHRRSHKVRGTIAILDETGLYKAAGIPRSDGSKRGSPGFFAHKARASVAMAALPLDKKLACVRLAETFTGGGEVLGRLAGGDINPYAVARELAAP